MTESSEVFSALKGVYEALEPLDPTERRKVLDSVSALMEIPAGDVTPVREDRIDDSRPSGLDESPVLAKTAGRPLSLIELIQEKKPSTNAEYITLFAYYREKVEGVSRFARADLRDYFSKAKLAPPGNFDRDFNGTVRRGWIHEDGADSYLTSKGIETVESAFASATSSPAREPRKRKATARKGSVKKSPGQANSRKSQKRR